MVAAALVGRTRANECSHSLEDLIEPTHLPIEEVALVLEQEHKVQFLFLAGPVADVHTLQLLITAAILTLLGNLELWGDRSGRLFDFDGRSKRIALGLFLPAPIVGFLLLTIHLSPQKTYTYEVNTSF